MSISTSSNNSGSGPRRTKPPVRKKQRSVADYLDGILAGDRMVLSQAITMVESRQPKHRALARSIVDGALPYAGKSLRLGITGVPGVGKSTFIEALGTSLTEAGHKLAVLAIDPSSQRSKGSILGDKTRMEELAADSRAFIRPSPSAGTLGGVAKATRETITLCEAAGFDVILVETVGVGQSEIAVHSMVDFFLLLMLAGAGDELQGIKRGIMEMADAIVINKADGDNIAQAKLARRQYMNALHLFPPAPSGWTPPVNLCSAIKNSGITEVWAMIGDYQKQTDKSGYFKQKRQEQDRFWLHESIRDRLREDFFEDPRVKEALPELEKQVSEGLISSHGAADKLLELVGK